MKLDSPKQQESGETTSAGIPGGVAMRSLTDEALRAAPLLPRTAMHLSLLAVALAALAWIYRDTLGAMADIWNRSDTYAHGYLVAPISLWLMWRRRAALKALQVRLSWLGLLLGALAGFAWLLGELASVDSVSQFALVGMIIALAWGVMGTAVARAYAFPLLFLFFLVPFGEFLFPTMMDWTTSFVIGALRLFGVPVFAEGRSLIIPSGSWQVVEGCSGVRYLIASVVVGSLYSYLSYRSLSRRLIFTAASVVLPVLANWVRAWGIVMLGHFSNNKLATGFDHIIYGWVFFGVVMLLLFWVGSRWQEDEAPLSTGGFRVDPSVSAHADQAIGWPLLAGALGVLLAVFVWKPLRYELTYDVREGPVRLAPLATSGGWKQTDLNRLVNWAPSYAGMQGDSRSAWIDDGKLVGMYVAYYRNQQPGKELINSGNRVLISKDPVWTMAGYGQRQVSFGKLKQQVLSTEIRSSHGRLLVWHLYWIGGRWTTNDYVAKVYLALAQLRGAGDDSALVMVYTPHADGESAAGAQALDRFLSDMGPRIDEMLATTAANDVKGAR